MMELKNITLGVKDGRHRRTILNNINLTAKRGELTTVYGNSGSGKSVLMQVMALIKRPDSGSILFNNKEEKPPRNEIGIIPQSPALCRDFSVIENVLLSGYIHKSIDKKKAAELLEQLGIDRNLHNESIQMLSGGEQQRIAIARAIYSNPQYLFMDEPTSSLDEENKTIFQSLINDLKKDRIIVMNTHDKDFLSMTDNIIKIKHGQLLSASEDLNAQSGLEQFVA